MARLRPWLATKCLLSRTTLGQRPRNRCVNVRCLRMRPSRWPPGPWTSAERTIGRRIVREAPKGFEARCLQWRRAQQRSAVPIPLRKACSLPAGLGCDDGRRTRGLCVKHPFRRQMRGGTGGRIRRSSARRKAMECWTSCSVRSSFCPGNCPAAVFEGKSLARFRTGPIKANGCAAKKAHNVHQTIGLPCRKFRTERLELTSRVAMVCPKPDSFVRFELVVLRQPNPVGQRKIYEIHRPKR
jgi:hypothetical protein